MIQGPTELDHLFDLATSRFARGDAHGAIDLLRRLLGAEPDHAGGHAVLALCLRSQRRLHAAHHEARLALALAPELPLAHYALGEVALARGKTKEAQGSLEQALALDPEQPLYLRGLASLWRLRGEREKAHALLERALAAEPSDETTLAALGDLLLEMGRVEEAERCAREALELQPESVDALVLQGRLLLRRGKIAEAREHALWALRIQADDPDALHFLVEVKARTNLLLGLWWRYAAFMSTLGDSKQILVLTCAFGLYRVLLLVARDLGPPALQEGISLLWLGLVAYSWFGPAVFQRMLAREQGSVALKPGF